MKKTVKKIFFLLCILLVGIQFIPSKRNVSNVVYKSDFMALFDVPIDLNKKLTVSCYDCHSNNTKYPWYNRIQPIAWYLEGHIKEGKDELNFNEFGKYSSRRQKSKLTSIIREIEGDKMPLKSYVNLHEKAKINEVEKKELLVFFEKVKESIGH